MGICNSSSGESVDKLNRKRKSLHEDFKHQLNLLLTINILTLGAGESGKSTLIQQLKLIHGVKMEKHRLVLDTLQSNIIDCMKALLKIYREDPSKWKNNTLAAGIEEINSFNLNSTEGGKPNVFESNSKNNLQGELLQANNNGLNVDGNNLSSKQNPDKEKYSPTDSEDILNMKISRTILEWDSKSEFTSEVAKDIQKLFGHWIIQTIYKQKSKYWILDSCGYYMENILRYVQNKDDDSINLTEEDFLRVRTKTTGVSEYLIDCKKIMVDKDDVKLKIVDVGGQRSERRKWINCFGDAKMLFFVVNLNSYNQVMYENKDENRLIDSLEIFKTICKNKLFEKTKIILWFTKLDIFMEEIKKCPIDSIMDKENKKVFIDFKACDYSGEIRTTILYSKKKKAKTPKQPENLDELKQTVSAFANTPSLGGRTCATQQTRTENNLNDSKNVPGGEDSCKSPSQINRDAPKSPSLNATSPGILKKSERSPLDYIVNLFTQYRSKDQGDMIFIINLLNKKEVSECFETLCQHLQATHVPKLISEKMELMNSITFS